MCGMTRRSLLVSRLTAAALVIACCSAPAFASGTPAAGGTPHAHAAKTYRLSASSSGSLRFTRTRITATRGSVTLRLSNPSPVDHAIAIRGREGRTAGTGGVSRVTVTLKAGTYTYYCPVGDHRAEGMTGRLVVR